MDLQVDVSRKARMSVVNCAFLVRIVFFFSRLRKGLPPLVSPSDKFKTICFWTWRCVSETPVRQ